MALCRDSSGDAAHNKITTRCMVISNLTPASMTCQNTFSPTYRPISIWPTQRLTPSNGTFQSCDRVRATMAMTVKGAAMPGPLVYAMPSMSLALRLASTRALRTSPTTSPLWCCPHQPSAIKQDYSLVDADSMAPLSVSSTLTDDGEQFRAAESLHLAE